MDEKPREWFKQANYDFKTAEIMFNNKRYIYTVFMCHLSIEKALKGLYFQKFNTIPPKTHNLIFLVEKISLDLSEEVYDFIVTLNGVSIPTRYPDDLQRIIRIYNRAKTKALLEKSQVTLRWLKSRLKK